jgi:RING finger protein 121/175
MVAEEDRATSIEAGKKIVINNVQSVQRGVYVDHTERGTPFFHEIYIVKTGPTLEDVFYMLTAMGIFFVFVQIICAIWKHFHRKSYRATSSLVLLFLPFYMAVSGGRYVFLSLWALFFFLNTTILGISMGVVKRIPSVYSIDIYRVFSNIFKATFLGSISGYSLLFYGYFWANEFCYGIGIPMITYSLYFALLGRNAIEQARESTGRGVLPFVNAKDDGVCGKCQKKVDAENVYRLQCNHRFHKECLKDWCIFGKKNTCPVFSCREQVDLSGIPMNPWQRNKYFFTQFLDFLGNVIISYAFLMVYLWRKK